MTKDFAETMMVIPDIDRCNWLSIAGAAPEKVLTSPSSMKKTKPRIHICEEVGIGSSRAATG